MKLPRIHSTNIRQCPCSLCQENKCYDYHTLFSGTGTDYSTEGTTAMLFCRNCSIEVTVEIPDHIPKKQVDRYVEKTAERLNRGELQIHGD